MLTKQENDTMCRVGPGTPMGNLFRSYWIPALHAEELPASGAQLRFTTPGGSVLAQAGVAEVVHDVGGDPVGVVPAIVNDHDFGRAGNHVDADHAVEAALGGGHEGVARAHDLVDAADARRAERERGDQD